VDGRTEHAAHEQVPGAGPEAGGFAMGSPNRFPPTVVAR
jgi:hypothetical protein